MSKVATKKAVDSTAAVRRIAIERIRPTPENAKLYRPVDPNDPEVRALAQSIRENGVREPFVITQDGYILSGHRRHAAAKLAGVKEVPCRIEPIRYVGSDKDEILRLLREYNRQRVKSVDEMLREEVVSADRNAAYDRLLAHRRKNSDMSEFDGPTLELGDQKERHGISERKMPMLEAVLEIIRGNRQFWPLSDRQIHYKLLNKPPLRNTSRPDSVYRNDRASYGDLCDMLTRARLWKDPFGGQSLNIIPWSAIADATRPVTHWQCYSNSQDFIRQELDSLFTNYARNLQRSQPNHIEIIAEKMTVQSIVKQVASKYCIPVSVGRGYCSITPRHEMAERFWNSGKDQLILLILSDFDPDGESIAESFARSMRDDFEIDDLVPIKVALTAQQIKSLGLPPSMEAKKTSAQYRKFTEKYGDDVFELEAVPPETLQRFLIETIDSVMDAEAYNEEIDLERDDAAQLEEARQRARIALAGMNEENK